MEEADDMLTIRSNGPMENKAMSKTRHPIMTASICLLLIACGAYGAEPVDADPLETHNVTWTTPSEDYNGSMPIGNGETGLNLWVEPNGDLVFLMSRTDSWDEHLRLCKLGRVRIKFAPGLAGAEFKQELKLRQGEIEITRGAGDKTITARVWVDANRQVIHVDADSKNAFDVEVELELWREKERMLGKLEGRSDSVTIGPKTVYPDTVIEGQKNRIAWYHRNRISPWKETLELQHLQPAMNTGVDPLLHRTFGGVIQGKGLMSAGDRTLKSSKPRKSFRLSIHTHTQAPSTEEKWLNAIESNIAAAEAAGADKALKAHRTWWNEFWDRSWVYATGNADAEAITRGYFLQRWISACGGRGNFPIKFNGSIFTVNTQHDPDYRQWGGCYWFQNTRLPYWPMLASGDYEMMRPMFRMYLDALPLAKIRTQIYFGHKGAFFPETMTPWGTYTNGDYGGTGKMSGKPGAPVRNSYIRFHYTGTLELLAMMIDYYDHTGDKEFLKNELLPIADEFLLWWDEHWSRDENGQLNMYPSYACETYRNCTNPTPDLAGLMWGLDRLLALTDKEIGMDRRTRWMTFRKVIPAIPTTKISGQAEIMHAQSDISRPGNSENPNLYSIFPFRIYGVGKRDLEMARNTYKNRRIKGNNGWRQDDTQAAFLGLADAASKDISIRAKNKHKESRFPAFWGPNFDWTPDQCHGGNLLMGLQTMILQADDGKIRLLPAWPKNWNLDFKLHAPQRTVIEGTVRNGTLIDMTVTPESRKKDVIIMETQ